jgi:two-component system sensor histidine kinase KdpD
VSVPAERTWRGSPAAYLAAVGLVAAAALIAWPIHSAGHLSDVAMLFLLAIVIAAIRFGRGPALVASVLSVLCFDFFFVPPYLTLAVQHLRYVITFTVMIGVGVIISTMAERAHIEARRSRQAEIDQASERIRSALLSSVSHDLRTPLAVITGSATAMLDGKGPADDASQRELLATIRDEAARLAKLVTDLLEMSRVEAGALQVRRQWHSIEELLGCALAAVESRLDGRPIRVDAPADLPLASVDGALLQQALVNLLDNAIKHTVAGTPIDVIARTHGQTIEIEIADRGPGVPAADAERLFEKFARASGRGEGFGLGLAIVRGLIGAHGGRVEYRLRDGGGARFIVTLPTGGSPPPEPEVEPLAEARS